MNSKYLMFVSYLEWECVNVCVCGWARQGKHAIINIKYQEKIDIEAEILECMTSCIVM